MQQVLDWVKSIVFYLILLTVVSHLIPNKKYEKYLRLFTGMLLMILIIRPVTTFFSLNENMDTSVIEQIENLMGEEGKELGNGDREQLMRIQEEQMEQEFERQIEVFVREEARRLGMNLVSFSMEIERKEDVLVPASMQLKISRTKETMEEITIADIVIEEQNEGQSKEAGQLKKILAQYYGIEERKVQIRAV